MRKLLYVCLIVILVAIAAVVCLRFSPGGNSGEDNWICYKGIWVKHGNPSAPMPPTPCEE